MNKKIVLILLLFSLFFLNLKGLFSFDIYDLPLGLGPYEGETSIFASYGLGVDIARFADNEIIITRGPQYLSFSGSRIDINLPSFTLLPSNPFIEFFVNFQSKVPRPEIRFASVNITYEIKTSIPIGYIEVSFIKDNYIERHEGTIPTYIKISKNVTDYTGEYQLRIRVFVTSLGGPASISFNYIKQFAITNFVKANKHEMYLTKDFKNVTHKVELPIRYDSSKWDEFQLVLVYPKYYELISGKFRGSTISFKGWSSYEKGDAKYLYALTPFGSSTDGILELDFESKQSVYSVLTQSASILKAGAEGQEIKFTPLTREQKVFAEGDLLSLVSANIDFKIIEQPTSFIYTIKDPEGNRIITSYFSKVTLNKTRDIATLLNRTIVSPLDNVVLGTSNIKLDFINGKLGEWKIVVVSVSRYNIGINETSFIVYNFKFDSGFVEFSSNFGFKGNFSFSSNFQAQEPLWKGSYLILIDPSTVEEISTRYFKVINTVGVSSIAIFRSLINLTEPGPRVKDLTTYGLVTINFVILNNSSSTAFISRFDLELVIFDVPSRVSVDFVNLGELNLFNPYESRFYLLYLVFGISKGDQIGYLASPLAFLRSTVSNKNVTIVFPENEALYTPLKYKVLFLKVKVGDHEASSNYVLLYPKDAKISSGKVFGIFETKINPEGRSYFELDENIASKISDLRKIEAYALAYTRYYGALLEKIFEDDIEVKGYLELNTSKIVKEEGEEILLNLVFKSNSKHTVIKFDLKVYIGSELINDTPYTISPSESLNIQLKVKMPKTSGEILKIKSNTLKSIFGLIELENPTDINKQILEAIPPEPRNIITSYVPREYVIYFIIAGIILLIALILLVKKAISYLRKE
ncbi:MAG: hypothetical protein RQ968_05760 [Thermoproteota archaeon]|nr:hypothetical protein [Thermoproteota archaeon]